MPRKRKPYTLREKNRHGSYVWYFRRGKGKRVRLPGEYESPEWRAAYEAALGGVEPPKPMASGTFKWLVERYMESAKWASLATGTQRFRRQVLMRVAETGGHIRISQITRRIIADGRDRRAKTPAAAVNYLKVMNQIFAFAIDAGYMTDNPAKGIEKPRVRTTGHHPWSIDEVHRYQAKWPTGTQQRLALDVLLYTGFRRGDAVLFGKQHVRNEVITLRNEKTGTEVIVPLLSPLRRSIDATKTGDLVFLCTSHGQPWKKESFGNWFREQCEAAGVPGRAHGLRKAGATIAAENGATDLQLMAIFGWTTAAQAGLYTKSANRAKLAEQGAALLVIDEHEPGTSIPAPSNPVRGKSGKTQK
ncbi:site-specific integrase [Devosia sp. MC521]|uniref:tyrosine-type recombinase/integrase n=1 Tax=Devosia sp. MC521 TaxID=2759954 RepID=UPI0015F8DB00|nr:site-specific integrase [Devosia sp. MC521]MBJ6986895.1 tyrosine-type recombinase/integrase [Devosia sp. MC521]QMW63921.1 tyrosine-type recombinase/integrase [Devosia sp. MC521]